MFFKEDFKFVNVTILYEHIKLLGFRERSPKWTKGGTECCILALQWKVTWKENCDRKTCRSKNDHLS